MNIDNHPGYIGAFTRDQAAGPDVIPNGARIVKVATEEKDMNPVGTKGTVLGSIRHAEVHNGRVFYFVEWDTAPRVAVGCIGWKIARVEDAHAEAKA